MLKNRHSFIKTSLVVGTALFLGSLGGLFAEDSGTPKQTDGIVKNTNWESQYNRIDPKDLPDNVVDLIRDQWMVVTAGKKNSFNSMVINWGAIGNIWAHPAAFIFVRDSRYTYQFLQREEGFTLSVFTEQYREAQRILGTKSGRDSDKIKESGLTVMETPSGLLSYKEARMIIECKKMMVQDLDPNKATPPYKDDIARAYKSNPASHHQMFISEITAIWLKK